MRIVQYNEDIEIEERDPWERRQGEGARAYDAFVVYRDMKTKRSVKGAYAIFKNNPNIQYANGSWTQWAVDFEWKRRGELYDVYMEKRAREAREKAYIDDLEDFKKKQKSLSDVAMIASVQLFQKALARLKEMNSTDITPNMVSAMFRAAAAVSDTATNSGAQVLALEEVLKAIDG